MRTAVFVIAAGLLAVKLAVKTRRYLREVHRENVARGVSSHRTRRSTPLTHTSWAIALAAGAERLGSTAFRHGFTSDVFAVVAHVG